MQNAKIYSASELESMATAHFKQLGVKVLYATSDGQFFVLENRAHLHAGAGGVVHTLLDEGAAEVRAAAPTLDEVRKAIGAETSVEALRAMMLQEAAGANRAEAISVIEARIGELYSVAATRDEDAQPKAKLAGSDVVGGDLLRNAPDAQPIGSTPTAADIERAKIDAAPMTAPATPVEPDPDAPAPPADVTIKVEGATAAQVKTSVPAPKAQPKTAPAEKKATTTTKKTSGK